MRVAPYRVEAVMTSTNEIPYGVRMVEAPSLWEREETGEGIVVAVLDTGCDMNHPDLKPQIIAGYNFTNDYNANRGDFNDNNGHGTHVCGTIAASLDEKGVVGVAPKCKLLVCKVLSGDGSGQYDWIIKAIHYAIDWKGPNGERVRVINMSLGGPYDLPELYEAVKRAVDNDICVVVAAGNEGDDDEGTYEVSYPANYNEVIEVGAVGPDKKMAYFSNTNTEVDVVAPGVDILSTYPNGRYASLSGTSMATPHVSGAIALLVKLSETAFKRPMTEAEIYAQLVKNTIPLGYQNSTEGNGLVKLDIMDRLKALIHYIQTNY